MNRRSFLAVLGLAPIAAKSIDLEKAPATAPGKTTIGWRGLIECLRIETTRLTTAVTFRGHKEDLKQFSQKVMTDHRIFLRILRPRIVEHWDRGEKVGMVFYDHESSMTFHFRDPSKSAYRSWQPKLLWYFLGSACNSDRRALLERHYQDILLDPMPGPVLEED